MAWPLKKCHNITFFFNDVIFYDVFRLKLDTLVNGMAFEETNTPYLIQTGELLSGKNVTEWLKTCVHL
jgi:hypothetical protein